jgi:hypothetical protein
VGSSRVVLSIFLFCALSAATAFGDPASSEAIAAMVQRLQYTQPDDELPSSVLSLPGQESHPSEVSSAQASVDVERLFYLLSHGYSGYGIVDDPALWQSAKNNILADLGTASSWQVASLPQMIRSRMSFVQDIHLTIGDQAFGEHLHYWYDTTLEFQRIEDAYACEIDGLVYSVASINQQGPEEYLQKSLGPDGDELYRLGILSHYPPDPIVLVLENEANRIERTLTLRASEVDRLSVRAFREDRVGGIPVLRIQSFGDNNTNDLQRWLESAERLRGEPCVIVDLRGNGGGNERWASAWIQSLTGVRPQSILIFSEFVSQTTMIGRANAFAYWSLQSPRNSFFRNEEKRYRDTVERLESGLLHPHWTGPVLPVTPAIENDTKIVVITDGRVASAGEGFVMRVKQAENVVVVGENTLGALTFGNISLHVLPESGIKVWLPINFNLSQDLVSREGVGLAPDYWVPARDAVDYAVAAVLNGTIETALPLPARTGTRFIREAARAVLRRGLVSIIGACIGLAILALGWKRRWKFARPGTIGTVVGIIYVVLGALKSKPFLSEVGVGLIGLGVVVLVGAVVHHVKEARP